MMPKGATRHSQEHGHDKGAEDGRENPPSVLASRGLCREEFKPPRAVHFHLLKKVKSLAG